MKAILEVVDIAIDDEIEEEPAEIYCSHNCDSFNVTHEEFWSMLERIVNERSFIREYEATQVMPF